MKIAWLFPGQGAQKVGMGQALAEAFTSAKHTFELADSRLGFALSTLCFEGPESELQLTANTQPAIVATSCATVAALKQALPALPAPVCVAGHSLGEYSALAAAGALSVGDAVALVRLRGAAMQRAVPEGYGAMLAVIGADPAAVEQLCEQARQDQVLSAANFNSPGQIVVAGHAEAVARAQVLAKERKLRAIPLKVSAPFHCALMRPAAEELRTALTDIHFTPLRFPVIANVDAEPYAEASLVADKLVAQVDGAVRWDQSMRQMQALGVTHALELGPGSVLSGLMRKIAPGINVLNVDGPEAIKKVESFLTLQ